MTIMKKAFIKCAVKMKLLRGRYPISDFFLHFWGWRDKSVEKGQEKEIEGDKGGRRRGGERCLHRL